MPTAVPAAAPTLSFELYPPRRAELVEVVWQRILRMADAGADFFSVTYGASGSSRDASGELVRRILRETGVPVIAHLTCVDATRDELAHLVRGMLDAGVRDFLALRGDPPAGTDVWAAPPGGVGRSSELVALIREVEAEWRSTVGRDGGVTDGPSPVGGELGVAGAAPVSVSVAAYPSGRSHSRADELAALREKQESGADFAITQVFFERDAYASLVDDAHAAGITIPVLPGVIPLTDPGRLHRLSGLTGVDVPPWLDELLDVADEPERLRRGVEATADLVDAALAAGAPGVHLYTFNKDRPALDVVDRLRAAGLRNPALTGGTRGPRTLVAG